MHKKILFPPFNNSIKRKYSKNALILADKISRLDLSLNELNGRKFKEGITIDDIGSRDLDDAIWAYRHDYGYTVEISIADVSEFIEFNSDLDLEALERSTSVYFNTHALFMLPEDITINKLSLNNDTTRLTLTVTINLDLEFNVVDTYIEETFFHNIKRFCYKTFSEDYYNTESRFHTTLSLIHKIAIGLCTKRYKNIVFDDFKDDDRKLLLDIHKGDNIDGKEVVLNDNNQLELEDIEYDLKKIPSFCIQEFMILANKEVARFASNNSIPITFRNHMPNLIGLNKKVSKMERAFYKESMEGHLALGEQFYCHFTSPIRRYADLVLHRQIKFFINNKKLFYTKKNMKDLCLYINKKVHSIIDLQMSEEREIITKKNDRLYNKLTKDIDSDDLHKLDFKAYEKLMFTYLKVGISSIIFPEKLILITYEYLSLKKNFSDSLIMLLFFTNNNLELDELFNFINTKHPSYITNILDRYFKTKGMFYSQRNYSSKPGTIPKSNFHTEANESSSFQKIFKQNRRTTFNFSKPKTYQVKLELFVQNKSIVKLMASSKDESGAEIRAYSKFFRKIVSYYRKNNLIPTSLIEKAWYLYIRLFLYL